MAVGKQQSETLLPVEGVKLKSIAANIKRKNRKDLSIIEIAEGSGLSAVFTRNVFCAAPVQVAKKNLSHRNPQQKSYLLINTGYANAGTGTRGLEIAQQSCQFLANITDVSEEQVLPFSTGVIGELLPVDRLHQGIEDCLIQGLGTENWQEVAEGILTTDTRSKAKSLQVEISGKKITLTGIAKGSGMIKPNMATMLAYIASDIHIEQKLLDELLIEVADKSFNCITVDGDTSTNDAFVLIASGKSGVSLDRNSTDFLKFKNCLIELAVFLAQAIVRDGEGATKFISVNVNGGESVQACRQVAYTIAHSPLVKTAFFASDPNWGRILAALGRSELENLNIHKVDISLDGVCVIKQGELNPDYTEQQGRSVMAQEEISINITLGRGNLSAQVWTCDFSYDYVKINAEYRS